MSYHASMIREATPADLPAIVSLIRALAEYEHLSHEVTLDEKAMRDHLFGPTPAAHVVVAEHDRDVVGFALYFTNYSTFLGKPGIYLEDLFVRPEHRGHGHGTALLKRLAQIVVERGYGRLEWSVLDWNAPSIAFYKKLGAVPMEEWTVYRVTGEALTKLGRA